MHHNTTSEPVCRRPARISKQPRCWWPGSAPAKPSAWSREEWPANRYFYYYATTTITSSSMSTSYCHIYYQSLLLRHLKQLQSVFVLAERLELLGSNLIYYKSYYIRLLFVYTHT